MEHLIFYERQLNQNDDDRNLVTVKLSMLNVAMIIASVLYIVCFVLAKRKLASIQQIELTQTLD